MTRRGKNMMGRGVGGLHALESKMNNETTSSNMPRQLLVFLPRKGRYLNNLIGIEGL